MYLNFMDTSHFIYCYLLCGCCCSVLLLLRLLKILSSLVGGEFGHSAVLHPEEILNCRYNSSSKIVNLLI